MHNIQRKILGKLLYTKGCNYAAMRPKGVESNHFAYHLERLIKNQLIIKRGKSYSLSPLGLSLIDRLSQEKMVERLQPHIVTAIDLTNELGQTLVFTRNFQPFIDLAGWPMGKTHMEEDIFSAANRELYEKTNLQGIELEHRGMLYIDSFKDDTRISKVLYHIFQGKVEGSPKTITPENRGVCEWIDHKSLAATQCMPGFLRGKQLLETSSNLFFEEIIENIDY